MKKLCDWLTSFRKRQHSLWLFYENITAILGLTIIPTFTLALVWNPIAVSINWPTFLFEYNEYLIIYATTSVAWMIKSDWVKYRITKDPRDKPFRKWFSFRYAGHYKPDEISYTPDGFEGDLIKLIPTICPKCNVTHLFAPDEKESRRCPYRANFIQCDSVVEPPSYPSDSIHGTTIRSSEVSNPDKEPKGKKRGIYLLVYVLVFLYFKARALWRFLFGEDD